MPDWFDRHPIHRWSDTKELFLDRVCRIPDMKPGIMKLDIEYSYALLKVVLHLLEIY